MSGLAGYDEARTRLYWRGVFDRARESGISDKAHRYAVSDMMEYIEHLESAHYAAERYRAVARRYARKYP